MIFEKLIDILDYVFFDINYNIFIKIIPRIMLKIV